MIGPGAMNVFCAACDTRLRTRFDTNGMGTTLELVEPCPTCIKSRSAVVITRGPEYVVRHGECDRCGEAFEWKKPGMVPQECSACSGGAEGPNVHVRGVPPADRLDPPRAPAGALQRLRPPEGQPAHSTRLLPAMREDDHEEHPGHAPEDVQAVQAGEAAGVRALREAEPGAVPEGLREL